MMRGKKLSRRIVSAVLALLLTFTMTMADCAQKVRADEGLAETAVETVVAEEGEENAEIVEGETAETVSEETAETPEENAELVEEAEITEGENAELVEEAAPEEGEEIVDGEEGEAEELVEGEAAGLEEGAELEEGEAVELVEGEELEEGEAEELEEAAELEEGEAADFAEGEAADFVEGEFEVAGLFLADAPEVIDETLDSDYDGIPDYLDNDPYNNVFTGKMTGYDDIAHADYTMNLSALFGNLTEYNYELSTASIVMSNIMYGGDFFYDDKFIVDGVDPSTSDIVSFLEYHGFRNVYKKHLAKINDLDGLDDKAFADDDLSEIGIGYRDVTVDDETKRVVVIAIRGTNGSIQEWSSNFDIGNPRTETWGDKEQHKGFYITSERLLEYVNLYAEEYLTDDIDTVYWICGHSRGASLSNLLAAKLINNGEDVVAYTYAAAAVTVSGSRTNDCYDSIFNIVNTNDFIPCVPLAQWGFGLYGQTTRLDIDDLGLNAEWSEQTGGRTYNALDEDVLAMATNRIAKSIAGNWNEIFDEAGVQLISNKQYGYISARAQKYCTLKVRKFLGIKTGYKLYPTLAFVFQLAAELIAGSGTEKDNAVEIFKELWNSKYTAAIVLLVGDGIGNLSTVINHWPTEFSESLVGDGHAPATYYILVHGAGEGAKFEK